MTPGTEDLINTQKLFIKTLEEYIKFLGEEISNNAGYLYIHGIQTSIENIEKGRQFRKRIEELKSQL